MLFTRGSFGALAGFDHHDARARTDRDRLIHAALDAFFLRRHGLLLSARPPRLRRWVSGNQCVVLAGSGFFLCERIHAAVRAWSRKATEQSVGADPCADVAAWCEHPTRGQRNACSLAIEFNLNPA